jgi:hypothetical protein
MLKKYFNILNSVNLPVYALDWLRWVFIFCRLLFGFWLTSFANFALRWERWKMLISYYLLSKWICIQIAIDCIYLMFGRSLDGYKICDEFTKILINRLYHWQSYLFIGPKKQNSKTKKMIAKNIFLNKSVF